MIHTPGPGARLGRYVLGEELGSGGMAAVFRAEDTSLRREVAIKVLYPHLLKERDHRLRFLREARAAAGLDHPHILKVFDVGEDDPAFIVMELVRGRSLKQFLDDGGAPLAEIVALVGKVLAGALGVAHAACVVHRDVKPANVMISDGPGGRLILCDFGVARIADDDAVQTQSGVMLGTPAFMSPEQALGKPIDRRSDIYSLGATLYQLATGSLPVSGSTAAVINAVIAGNIQPILRRNPTIGPDLARVIERAMAKDPAKRYATCEEFGAALGEVAAASAGLGEADLGTYFADPAGWNRDTLPRIVDGTLRRAREAAEKKQYARALALADRVLAFEPANAAAGSLVARIGKGARAWRRTMVAVGVLGVAAVGVGVAVAATGHRHARVAPDGGTSEPGVGSGSVVALISDPDAHRRDDPPTPVPPTNPHPVTPDPTQNPSSILKPNIATPNPNPNPNTANPNPLPFPSPSLNPDAGPAPDLRPATVDFKITPWCELIVDGKPAGQSPRPISLPPGHHHYSCSQASIGGPTVEDDLELLPDGRSEVIRTLIRQIRVTVDFAGASIDGNPIPRGQSISLTPGNHRVGNSRVDFPNKDCSLRDLPELGCY